MEQGLLTPEQYRVRTTGERAPHHVVEVRPTGQGKAGHVQLSLRVLVTPEVGAAWEADTSVFVYLQAVSYLQVGSPIVANFPASHAFEVLFVVGFSMFGI